tara:strand:- start:847 stop:1038 length:192 start_codon:yes stop_codon:yes gene_type:complete
MSYSTNKKTKARIDKLLEKNAQYQAEHTCVKNSKTRREEIMRHCRVNFLNPIKDIDPEFYKRI